MKIILFTDSLGAGGAQRQLVGLAKLLNEAGDDVKVLTYHKNEFYAPILQDNGIKYVLLENAEGGVKRIISFIKYIKKEKPNSLIAYQETPSLIACLAKICSPKVNLIVSERNTTQHIDWNARIRFFLYKWANKIVPNSYSQERFIKRNYPQLSSKVFTITNFVDLDKFCAINRKSRSEIPVVMVAASIFEPKNTLGLIEAAKLIKERGVNVLIKWYGFSGTHINYYNNCLQKIKEYSLDNFIQLLPKTKDIRRCYDQADYFCLPSFFEGTPNVICEAISCGLPVACSDVSDNSIYVHEGVNGTLFNPSSPQSMADGILRLLSISEKQYIEYSRKSRQLAEEVLSSKIFLEKYQIILKS